MMNNKNWKTRLPVDMADSATGLTELLDLRGLVDRVGEHLLFLLLSVLSQRHCTGTSGTRGPWTFWCRW
jgi:hypothetical protein